jgi:hypothetical protein
MKTQVLRDAIEVQPRAIVRSAPTARRQLEPGATAQEWVFPGMAKR